MEDNIYRITKLIYGPYGITKNKNGKTILVERALPDDLISLKIKKSKKTYNYAEIQEIIEPSPYRDSKKFCSIFDKCGGCTYNDVSYDKQIELKEKLLKQMIEKEKLIIDYVSFIPSDQQFNYRIKSKFYINDEGFLSYNALRTNRLVAIEKCPILKDGINRVLSRFNKDIYKRGKLSANFENIEIYEGDNGIGVHFIMKNVNEKNKKRINDMVKRFNIISYTISNIKKGEFYYGGKKLILNFNGIKYKFYPGAFVQANKYIAQKMLSTIENYIKLHSIEGTLLDLYAGFGFFSFYLKDYFSKIYMVENSPYAINDMKGIFNKMNDIFIYPKSVSSAIVYIKKTIPNIDLIILDPPRTNPPEFVFNKIASINASYIIYISCNPPALFHNLKKFIYKYHIDNVIGFDMFPNTYHQEVIAFLRRK